LASIVSAAIDVVLARPEQLPARIAVLEEALKNHPKAAEALAQARSALAPKEWTEKAVVDLLSAKMRATATVTKTQSAAIREYVGKALDETELNLMLDELKTTKGPRNIARLIAKYDGNVISLIVAAITE
jgi:cell division septum initiation protein DivIVA